MDVKKTIQSILENNDGLTLDDLTKKVEEKAINDFVSKYGELALIDSVKLSLYKTGHNVIEESSLSEIERKTVDWLVANFEPKLKDFFLADLSWCNSQRRDEQALVQQEREQAFVDFFTKRMGRRVLEQLPEDIKNYVLAHSIK